MNGLGPIAVACLSLLVLQPARAPAPRPATGPCAQEPEKIGFALLAGFDYAPGRALPAKVIALDEKLVAISGFMQREAPGSGPVSQFLLINDSCGCNGTPKLNEIVFCALPEGKTMEPLPGIVHVTGKLYVGEQKEDGEVVALYTLDADTVR